MNIKIFSITILAVFIALSGCATGPVGNDPSIEVIDSQTLPPPTRNDLFAASRPYLIGPFDKLKIDVFGVEDLQKEVQIDASGRLSFPLIGEVEASGSTPSELANLIKERLSGRFVRDPQVTVNLTETVSQVITVDGSVDEPGLYPVVGKMTLMRAVATAGGLTEFAGMENVVVFRTVNGQDYAALFNLKAIRRGNYSDPEIYANDVIVVSESRARRIFRDLLQAAPLLTTPIIVLARN
ncbi:polysaccharide biosynthesis/export family protein [Altererythrobacter sp. MF3-039]|uniref:polysaccharide biosynthesis/export family protein n=1 Tax=Altererythrobacter sp. MF3-039 TaxID=3252901 RepID=UPI00390CB927